MTWELIGRDAERARTLAALRPSSRSGVLLRGPAGVGKTSLLRAVVDDLRVSGREVVPIRAVGHAVPYGAVVDLLPRGADGPPLEVLRAALDQLVTRAGPPVAVADDVDRIDDASLALLDAALARRLLTVLATLRDDESEPEVVARWPRDRGVVELRLSPLGAEVSRRLAEHLVGGRVGEVTAQQLHRRTGGNPLFLGETVRAALDAGRLHPDPDGTFRARTEIALADGLVETVARRLGTLLPAARRTAQLVALGQPLPPALLVAAGADSASAAALARRGLLHVEDGAVRLAHPLHGEAVLAALDDDHRRALLGRLVTALGATPGEVDDELRLRIVAAQTELGGPAPEQVRVDAAGTALSLGDVALARRLLADVAGFDSELLRAELEVLDLRPDDALARLSRIRPRDPSGAARVALLRSRIELITLGRVDAALETLEAVGGQDESTRGRVRAATALVRLLAGQPAGAAELADELPRDQDAAADDPLGEVATLVSTSISEMLLGRLPRARRQALRGLTTLDVTDVRVRLPFAETQLGSTLAYVEMYDGRIEDAVARCRDGRSVRGLSGGPVFGLWTSLLADAEQLAGRVERSREVAADAVAAIRVEDPLGHLGLALSRQGVAAALLGEQAEAAAILAELDGRVDAGSPRLVVNRARVRAWLAASDGDLAAARAHALAGADAAADVGYHAWALLAAHDLVRLDAASLAVPLVQRSARSLSGARLLELLVAHAHARADGDGDAVFRVAVDLEGCGAALLAAEAFLHAATAAESAGRGRSAVRSRRRARALAPAGVWTVQQGRPLPRLTGREHEVALHAAAGRTNREIADLLVVSVRTVENHLGSVYAKLGVDGRRGVAEVLHADLAAR